MTEDRAAKSLGNMRQEGLPETITKDHTIEINCKREKEKALKDSSREKMEKSKIRRSQRVPRVSKESERVGAKSLLKG